MIATEHCEREELQQRTDRNSVVIRQSRQKRNKILSQHTQKMAQMFGVGGLAQYVLRQSELQSNHPNKKRVQNLVLCCEKLDSEQRQKKAIRHFYDAYHSREVRHDIECINYLKLVHPSRFYNTCYYIQTSTLFQDILYVLSICFLMLTYFEPANRYDMGFTQIDGILEIELLLILCFLFDLVLTIIHQIHECDRSYKENFLLNFKFIGKTLLIILFLIDFSYYYYYYDSDHLRIAKYFRPFLLMLYNQELRRTLKSIILSSFDILQMILFFVLMNFIWAVIGFTVIGSLDGQTEYNENFSNLFSATSILYALSSPDNYPDCMLASYEYSSYYAIYFLVFSVMFQLLFVPIPVAIVFEAFRKHRAELAMTDQLLQHENLLACFVSLDIHGEKRITFDQFNCFMKEIYLNKKRYLPRIHRLFILLDTDNTKNLSINNFFQIIDQMENDPKLNKPNYRDQEWWQNFRKFCKDKLYFKIMALSSIRDVIMMIVVIVDCTLILITISTDADYASTCATIDDYLVYIYIVEFIVKIIGLGIEKYFEDDWNNFDFYLIIISVLSLVADQALSFIKTFKTAKSGKVVKITKLNKLLRSLKGLRSLKALGFLVAGADSLLEFKLLITRLFMCVPLVFRLIPVVYTTFYIYALIGCDWLNIATFPYHEGENEFAIYTYTDFTSFANSILLMFQISIGVNWNVLVYDYQIKFDSHYSVILYFYTFHILTNLIILALIKGIIWEVFTVVAETITELPIPVEQIADDQDRNSVLEKSQAYDMILAQRQYFYDLKMSEFTMKKHPINFKITEQAKFIQEIESVRQMDTQKQPELEPILSSESFSGSKSQSPQTSQKQIDLSNQQYNAPDIVRHQMKESCKQVIICDARNSIQQIDEKNQKILEYFKKNFKTKKQRNFETRATASNSIRVVESGNLFDSDDESSLIPYHKQILDSLNNSDNQFRKLITQSLQGSKKEHIEKQIVEYQTKQTINQRYIFKKALLKDTNNEKIKKFEIDYFQASYGKVFETINRIDLGPLIKYESQVLHNLDRALRHNSREIGTLVKLLYQIELNVSNLMLCKGSVFKFMFMDSSQNWFYLNELDHQIVPCKADIGPWSYSDQIAKGVHIFLDYFDPTQESEIQSDILTQFYSIKTMVENSNPTFQNFFLAQTLMDCLMFKFSPQNQQYVEDTTMKYIKTRLPEASQMAIKIEQVAVFIVMYSGDKQKSKKNYHSRFQREVKLGTLDNLKKHFHHEEDMINEFVSLPLNYVVEFMEDLNQLLNRAGDKLIIKMNQYLNYRVHHLQQ